MSLVETVDKSAKLQLWEDIKAALQPLIDDSTINSVEVFNSQTDFEAQERPRKYPYVAIDMQCEWDRSEAHNGYKKLSYLLNAEQKGNCIVSVYVVFSQLENETQAFEVAEPVRHCVHRYVQELVNERFYTKLLRFNDQLDSSHDRVFNYIGQYRTQLTEMAIIADDLENVDNPDLNLDTSLAIKNDIIRTSDNFEE